MPNELHITLSSGTITIDFRVFYALLNFSYIREYVAYKDAIATGRITYTDLKSLALKADVPYPLFFAPLDKVNEQIKDMDKELSTKIPSNKEFRLSSRGRLKVEDIKLILKDLSRKQGLLAKHLLPTTPRNPFVGSLIKEVRRGTTPSVLAKMVRDTLDISLKDFRTKSKEKALAYLVERVEALGIFVSFSSHNYMPQTLKGVEMSGICLKDVKFPFIFINTKDGDNSPKIIEPVGRQTFTLLAMLVCIAMNKFVFCSKTKVSGTPYLKVVNEVVGEILIPEEDLVGVNVKSLDELKSMSSRFKVTPSMCLVRLSQKRMIPKPLADKLKKDLADEIKNKSGIPQQPLPVNAYLKYNGRRFSFEVLSGEKRGSISGDIVKNILFRKGKKMDPHLARDYRAMFKL